MLKRYIKIFAALSVSILVLSGLAGCVDDRYEELAIPGGNSVNLELVINSYGTRASGSDFSDAEKKVTSVDLFFYKTGADNETPIHYVRGVPSMRTETEVSNTGKLTVSVPEKIFKDDTGNTLFTTCKVFAAVNTEITDFTSEEKEEELKIMTLGELKALKVQTDWFITKSLMSENGDISDFNGFVMFTVNPAGDDVTYNESEKKITGTITVDKLTSKINLSLAFGNDEVSADLSSWTITASDPNEPSSPAKPWKVFIPKAEEKDDEDMSFFGDAVEAYIVNGVKTVPLSGAFNPDGSLKSLTEEDYFDLWDQDENNKFMNYAHGFAKNDDVQTYPYVVESPFYTYPNAWSDGVLGNATYLILKVNWYDSSQEISSIDTEDLLETYYKIPLNRTEGLSKDKILSNYHYSVKVKINTLGGLHFGEPLLLDECSYDILPWGEMDLEAKLRFTRYLEVRQEVEDKDGTLYTAIMNNLETVSIPFYSSHKVRIGKASISFYDYSSATIIDDDNAEPKKITVDITDFDAFTLTYDELVGDNNYAGAYIDEVSNRITIKHLFHPVKPTTTSDGHYVHVLTNENITIGGETITFKENTYSYYDIYLELYHTDSNQDFPDRTITIRQYPQMYLDITFNPGGAREGVLNPRKYGYIYVNGRRTTGALDFTGRDYGGVRGVAAGLLNGGIAGLLGVANNPMMYVVNVTNLGADDAPLHIGDPRVKYVNNDLSSERIIFADGVIGIGSVYMYESLPLKTEDDGPASWMYRPLIGSAYNINALAPVWKDGAVDESQGERYLTYYYPTDETPIAEVMNTIAPKFRIGSAYGGLNNGVNRMEARRRCATYQERGYPAGRWRLPTYGELLYIARLSYKRIIPELFEDNRPYWCASGAYIIKENTVTEYDSRSFLSSDVDGYTRCVYDEWYWTYMDVNGFEKSDNIEDPNKWSTFYWGDKPKSIPQNPNQN